MIQSIRVQYLIVFVVFECLEAVLAGNGLSEVGGIVDSEARYHLSEYDGLGV